MLHKSIKKFRDFAHIFKVCFRSIECRIQENNLMLEAIFFHELSNIAKNMQSSLNLQ